MGLWGCGRVVKRVGAWVGAWVGGRRSKAGREKARGDRSVGKPFLPLATQGPFRASALFKECDPAPQLPRRP